jgi:hypothetical protein
MDPVAHNRRAWDRLARVGSRFTRPERPLPRTHRAMRRMRDRRGHLRGRRLAGARVLVLVGGGGLHAVLFATLGAQTTLVDFSRRQVATVRVLARRARVPIRCVQRDMRDPIQRLGVAEFFHRPARVHVMGSSAGTSGYVRASHARSPFRVRERASAVRRVDRGITGSA